MSKCHDQFGHNSEKYEGLDSPGHTQGKTPAPARKHVGRYSMGYCCDGGPNGEKHSDTCRFNRGERPAGREE